MDTYHAVDEILKRLQEEAPIPPPKTAVEAVVALAAAARQSTMDDEGSAFVAQHLLRTINAVQALEDENARLRAQIAGNAASA